MIKLQIVAFVLLMLVSTASVSAQTTEFTYQGQLQDASASAVGNYDFEFLLFDALSGGNQVGATLTKPGVAVANGIFSVKLDFGSNFPGASRFLEIHVRLAGGGAFTPLAPRQSISSSPYSVKSLNADTSTNALQLAGIPANQFVQTGDPRLADARPPAAGSSNYVQNGTTQQTSTNFNISGDGTAGGTLTGNIVRATTQFNIGSSRILSNAGAGNLFAGVGAGTATTGISNTFLGFNAGTGITTGSSNVFVGSATGFVNNSSANTFIGSGAGNVTSGNANVFVGASAGQSNTTGLRNSFFGVNAGITNTQGSANTLLGSNTDLGANGLTNATAIGAQALVGQSNSIVLGGISGINNCTPAFNCADTNVGIGTTTPTQKLHVVGNVLVSNQLTASLLNLGSSRIFANGGFHNVYFGENSGSLDTGGGGIGTDNTFIGRDTGVANIGNNNSFFGSRAGNANTSGVGNTFIGDRSGLGNADGNLNSFFGGFAGINNTSGSSNTFLGNSSGSSNNTGSFNAIIGAGANVGASALTNATAIGSNARVDASNSMVLGSINGVNGATADTKVGIGTTAPSQKLHVVGDTLLAGNVFVGSGSPFLSILSGGGVGIGTALPTARLDARASSGYGIFGLSSASNPVGVSGVSISASNNFPVTFIGGAGVWGNTTTQVGVYGTSDSNYGVAAVSSSGGGLYARSTGGANAAVLDGTVQVNLLGAAGATNVCRNAANQLSFCSSSLKYKKNVGAFTSGLDLVKRLRPITFDWKDGGMHDFGLGAEDVAKIESLLVTYNGDGQVEGVKYDRIGVVLINAVKEQQAQIEALQNQDRAQHEQIERQNAVIEKQELEVAALSSLVCRSHRSAAVCRAKK